jgi:site-specific DNA recombinase
MRVALYARVSTEAQEARGTIGSQLEVIKARIAEEGHELVAEFCDDGLSGARLDRPGLDALRDAAEAGLFEAVWCLSPDRLARAYAYQMLVLDELERFNVRMLFTDAPALDDDPQARLLTQIQGVIAEYEKAKIAERYRRGKLWRSRGGEVISWKTPYGYRRVPRLAEVPAHLEVFESEAIVVHRIFEDYVAGGHSIRQICRLLNEDKVPSPTGNPVWGHSTVSRLLRNEAYVGRVYYNRTESVPTTSTRGRRSNLQRPRDKSEWICIPVPPIIPETTFDAAQMISRDNSKWSPRNTHQDAWMLRGLVKCGHCAVGVNCHQMRGRNGTVHRYYWCRNHDTVRSRGEHRRCPERNIRADELDAFVFDQVRGALLRPDVLLIGEGALAAHRPAPDDELLATELARLERKLAAAIAERRRLADLYQAGLVELPDLQRRAREIDARTGRLSEQRNALVSERHDLAVDNTLRQRVAGFAQRVASGIDTLDFEGRQRLMRLVVEEIFVSGWHISIRLRIPLDEPPPEPPGRKAPPGGRPAGAVSTKDRLRSLGGLERRQLPTEGPGPGEDGSDRRTDLRPRTARWVNFQPSQVGQISAAVDIMKQPHRRSRLETDTRLSGRNQIRAPAASRESRVPSVRAVLVRSSGQLTPKGAVRHVRN